MWSIFSLFSSFQLKFNFHFPVQPPPPPPPSRFNIPFQMFKRTFFCFFRSHTTSETLSIAQFLCACRRHRKPIASLFCFCISKLLHIFIILDCTNLNRVDTNQHAKFSPTQTNYFQSSWKLLSCRQLWWYSRAGSFFFNLWIWTLKSALSLYYGLSCLVVKKVPCEGEHTVREDNGQNKLWFNQVFRTPFVAMNLSHNSQKMRKHVHAVTASLLRSSSIPSWVDVATFFLSQILWQFYSKIVYTLWINFK